MVTRYAPLKDTPNLKKMAKLLASMGKGNDTMLVHVTPREAELLKANGGAGTINPKTGLRQYAPVVRMVAVRVAVAVVLALAAAIPRAVLVGLRAATVPAVARRAAMAMATAATMARAAEATRLARLTVAPLPIPGLDGNASLTFLMILVQLEKKPHLASPARSVASAALSLIGRVRMDMKSQTRRRTQLAETRRAANLRGLSAAPPR